MIKMQSRLTFPIFRLLAAAIITLPVHLAAEPVKRPVLVKQISGLETSWFASPIIYDLNGDGNNELIGTYYSIFVWDKQFNLLDKMPYDRHHLGRIYAPAVVADLDGDGIVEIVVGGSKGRVAAYEWRDGKLRIKSGWPVITYDQQGMHPEVRSLAAADLNHDGSIEIVAANTQTDTNEPQVYVYNADGTLYQPPGISWQAWPRYNRQTGLGNDRDVNGPGNHGFGCFGQNIGIGNLDDDPELEIVVTFDNHQINVFDHTGVSHLAADYFTNRSTEYFGNRMNWGQFIRWFNPQLEEDHYHLHTGPWPHPENQKWLQWTESPPNVVDINGDGKNEVVAVANVEKDVPYDTKHYSVMVLEGSYGDGSRSARRLTGWEVLPSSDPPQPRGSRSWYPPTAMPAPATVDILGDGRPEILVPMNDGYLYLFSAEGQLLWRYNFKHGRVLMYASEAVVVDLNQDGVNEIIFTTFGDPESITPGVAHGYLVILDADGKVLFDIELPNQGTNGNGKGAPAAPTVGDLTGDGALEIAVQTFGGSMLVYTVPGSASNSIIWPTGRGSYLRQGRTANADSVGELRVLTRVLPTGRSGELYQAKIVAGGGVPPYHWHIPEGELPTGLALGSTGALSGTPAAAGGYTFTVTVVDDLATTASEEVAVTILPPQRSLEIERAWVQWGKEPGMRDRFMITGRFTAEPEVVREGVATRAALASVLLLPEKPLAKVRNTLRAQTKLTSISVNEEPTDGTTRFILRGRRKGLLRTLGFKRSGRSKAFQEAISINFDLHLYAAQQRIRIRRP